MSAILPTLLNQRSVCCGLAKCATALSIISTQFATAPSAAQVLGGDAELAEQLGALLWPPLAAAYVNTKLRPIQPQSDAEVRAAPALVCTPPHPKYGTSLSSRAVQGERHASCEACGCCGCPAAVAAIFAAVPKPLPLATFAAVPGAPSVCCCKHRKVCSPCCCADCAASRVLPGGAVQPQVLARRQAGAKGGGAAPAARWVRSPGWQCGTTAHIHICIVLLQCRALNARGRCCLLAVHPCACVAVAHTLPPPPNPPPLWPPSGVPYS